MKKQDVGGIRKLRIRRKERQNSRENNKGEKKSENKWLAFGRDTWAGGVDSVGDLVPTIGELDIVQWRRLLRFFENLLLLALWNVLHKLLMAF